MNIIGFHKKIQDLNENVEKIIGFPKENWHRGGTEEEENTDGRDASAIVTRKSKIWTRMFRKSVVFQGKTDIGEEPKRKKTQPEEPQVR